MDDHMTLIEMLKQMNERIEILEGEIKSLIREIEGIKSKYWFLVFLVGVFASVLSSLVTKVI